MRLMPIANAPRWLMFASGWDAHACPFVVSGGRPRPWGDDRCEEWCSRSELSGRYHHIPSSALPGVRVDALGRLLQALEEDARRGEELPRGIVIFRGHGSAPETPHFISMEAIQALVEGWDRFRTEGGEYPRKPEHPLERGLWHEERIRSLRRALYQKGEARLAGFERRFWPFGAGSEVYLADGECEQVVVKWWDDLIGVIPTNPKATGFGNVAVPDRMAYEARADLLGWGLRHGVNPFFKKGFDPELLAFVNPHRDPRRGRRWAARALRRLGIDDPKLAEEASRIYLTERYYTYN